MFFFASKRFLAREGFEPGILCSVGGSNDHYATPPGQEGLVIEYGRISQISIGFQKTNMPDVPEDNLYLGVVLASVVILTGIFSYYQVKHLEPI
jgi:hypothetical protein